MRISLRFSKKSVTAGRRLVHHDAAADSRRNAGATLCDGRVTACGDGERPAYPAIAVTPACPQLVRKRAQWILAGVGTESLAGRPRIHVSEHLLHAPILLHAKLRGRQCRPRRADVGVLPLDNPRRKRRYCGPLRIRRGRCIRIPGCRMGILTEPERGR